MNTLIRLAALGVCLAVCSTVRATPILVARVDGGFLVGSNYLRSSGSRNCKLHYWGKRLLLMAGDNVAVTIPGVSFDMDKEIWQVFRQGMTDQQLLQAVQKVVVSDTHKIGISGLFAVVLLSTEAKEPRVWTSNIEIPGGSSSTPAILTLEQKIQVGNLMDWSDDGPPRIRQAPVKTPSDMVRILTDVELHHRKRPEDQGFKPPYIVVSLDANGLKYVEGDSMPCAVDHPLPRTSTPQTKALH